MLVKALPHVGEQHGETVCCAGVTENLEWRRQFPVKFRELDDDKFNRWDWVEYDWRLPGQNDRRPESRRVQEGTFRVIGKMTDKTERTNFLNKLIVPNTQEASRLNNTLALIRPINPRFRFKRKTEKKIQSEQDAYDQAVAQLSFFGTEREALTPCPFEFKYEYETEDGKPHSNLCGDWETSATFFKWRKTYGEERALKDLVDTFGNKYPDNGVTFAMGTHSRYPDVWLLVGVIRLDKTQQYNLSL